jgi:hypothetical protein
MRRASRTLARRIAVVALAACIASALAGTASAWDHRDRENGARVDHDGIYLAQRIGQCLNHTGPCSFGLQCPGGEYSNYAYATGRVYCESFFPPHPYPPSFFESLLGAR